MPDRGRERPVTNEDEIDRTGRDQQPTPKIGLGAPGSEFGQRTGLDADDAAGAGVDSADFPGTGALALELRQ